MECKCETCLYKKNCQFLAKHKKTEVADCTAYENAANYVRVVHGHWIEKPFLLGTSRFCSLCGSNYGMPHEIYNYCPNCGAKMDGGSKNEIK